jgi:nicotinamide mononucleotide transporter
MTWSYLELSATFFSLACTVLTIQRSQLAWPIGLVGIGQYTLIFWGTRLYADVVLQLFYAGQFMFGWHQWSTQRSDDSELLIRRLDLRSGAVWLISASLLGWVWGWALSRFTDAALPYPDALGAMLSLCANALLTLRYRENWLVWILADAVLMGVYAEKSLWITVGLYGVYLGMAIWGWSDWGRAEKKPISG